MNIFIILSIAAFVAIMAVIIKKAKSKDAGSEYPFVADHSTNPVHSYVDITNKNIIIEPVAKVEEASIIFEAVVTPNEQVTPVVVVSDEHKVETPKVEKPKATKKVVKAAPVKKAAVKKKPAMKAAPKKPTNGKKK